MPPSPLSRYLLAAYTLLIVYASLHPFTGWHDRGAAPLEFLLAPLPRYVTAFDLVANVVAYAPFGFLAVLAVHRIGRGVYAALGASLAAAGLSFGLELLQNYLPSRIASNLDLAANALGGLMGALIAVPFAGWLLRDAGLHALRSRLFRPGGRIDLGLVLIALWLVSQLNPETLLFGTGDLRELLQSHSGELHPPELFVQVEAGVAGGNSLAVGLLAAALLRRSQPGWLIGVALLLAALIVRTLAFGVLMSPQQVLAWMTPGALYGLAGGTLAFLAVSMVPRRGRLAVSALAVMIATALVNLAPENPYLSASLAVWRQGHFLNFNGLTRIVSALWPFAALAYLMFLAGERGRSSDERYGTGI